MQQTPGCLPIPNGGVTRQPSFGDRQFMLNVQGTPPGGPSGSPSSNPHSGLHPASYHALSFSALALGAAAPGSSPYSSSMAMSISPPRWGPGSLAGSLGGSGLGFGSGGFGSTGSGLSGSGGASFVGSVGGTLGTSFGRQAEGRERELEAKYVRDFTCCGRQLSGLHELLEHYEEEHAGLAADVRMAAINAAQTKPTTTFASNNLGGMSSDVPSTPGMMDMDMDMDETPVLSRPTPVAGLTLGGVGGVNGVPTIAGTLPGTLSGGIPSASASPWSAAFRPSNMQPPACVPPSVLSYPTPQPQPQPASPAPPKLTQEQLQAKALKKAQKRAAASTQGTATPPNEKEDNNDPPPEEKGEKRFRCPIEGCGKVYKQANGLKYHLTRSINSGHGNVAAMGGLLSMLGQDEDKS